MARLIDLDAAVAASDLTVRLGGQEYTIPGEVDVPRMLKWISYEDRFDKKDEDGEKLVSEVYEDILNLFRLRNPALDSIPISLTQIGELFRMLFETYNDAGDDDVPPTKPQTPSRKSSARSRSSKAK